MSKIQITAEYHREWRKKNLEKRRIYDREWKRQEKIKYPEKVKVKRRERYYRERKDPEWIERRKEYMRAYLKKWRKDNLKQRKRHREWMRTWYRKNGKKIRERRMSKIQERIAANLRSRIYIALKSKVAKSLHTRELIGTTVEELKKHLERQFSIGMTWENYGFYGWHIDHRLPLASFDLTEEKEQRKAFHYTNLQPLWAEDNLRKRDKIS